MAATPIQVLGLCGGRSTSNLFGYSRHSSSFLTSWWRNGNRLRSSHRLRITSEGIPAKLGEDSRFAPLNADDSVYGPPALLLVGFEADETSKVYGFLRELDGEFLKVIHCTKKMLDNSVWDAMHTEQSSLQDIEIAKSLPRMCLLSGLSGEEIMMFIDAFPETGLESAVFAAMVPNSADKLLRDVVEEIMEDHKMMSFDEVSN